MNRFEVTFEDVGFIAAEETDFEITTDEAVGFTEVALREGQFPKGIFGVVRGSISADDSVHPNGRDDDGDAKVFVSVTLLIEAEDIDAAYEFTPPTNMLTRLSDMMTTDVSLEGNWEVLEAQPLLEPAPGAAL